MSTWEFATRLARSLNRGSSPISGRPMPARNPRQNFSTDEICIAIILPSEHINANASDEAARVSGPSAIPACVYAVKESGIRYMEASTIVISTCRPIPVRSRSYRAAMTPLQACIPLT